MSKNTNLHRARKEKNDEFYTQLSDIERELKNYEPHFKDKVVYCNCDSPSSNFVKYFEQNKDILGIKEFYYSWYDKNTGNGDFRSPESIEILKECDIVVTNPPFSLFREFVDILETYNKQYLVIGSMNAITYKEIFKLIKEDKLWLGASGRIVNFEVPIEVFDSSRKDMFVENNRAYQKLGNVCWFTNLPHNKRNDKLILYKEYNEVDYPKYDNYFAWEVSKTVDIPINTEIEVILTEDELEQLKKTDYEYEIIEVIDEEI